MQNNTNNYNNHHGDYFLTMSLLGSAKFWTEDENPKEKVKFLKGGEFPKRGRNSYDFCPGGHIPRNSLPPRWAKILGHLLIVTLLMFAAAQIEFESKSIADIFPPVCQIFACRCYGFNMKKIHTILWCTQMALLFKRIYSVYYVFRL
jgi:hypothetical protein